MAAWVKRCVIVLLSEIGRQLGRKALAESATVAQPDTIVARGRKYVDQQLETAKPPKSVGRPRIDREIEGLVIRMARENRSWGYDHIQGSLKHLGYTISDQTVVSILKRHGIPPAPEREKTITWRESGRAHLDMLLATDFFNSKAGSWLGLIISYLLILFQFCRHPVQTMRGLFPQYRPGMYTLVKNFLNVISHAQSLISRVNIVVQPQPFLFCLGIRQLAHSGLARPHHCKCDSQVRDQVEPLPVTQVPIRDGPSPNQDLESILEQDTFRAAA